MTSTGDGEGRLRLSELVAALSLAVDLGLGQPMDHVLRQTLIVLRLAEVEQLTEDERAAIYYVSLLAWVGCMADSGEMGTWFGDDIQLRADSYDVDLAGSAAFTFFARHVGAGRSPLRRAGLVAQFIATGGRAMEMSISTHCEATGELADRLGLGPSVRDPLEQAFERWDGKGGPRGLRGDELAPVARIIHLADIVEVFHRVGGIDAAVEVAKRRRGTQFDPGLVDRFVRRAPDVLGGIGADSTTWDAVIASEPHLGRELSGDELDSVLQAFADYADLKTPFTVGHSRGVSELAATAVAGLGLPPDEVSLVRRAGLVHDLGTIGVPSSVWDKAGPLSDSELERTRIHPYLTERTLARSPALRRIAALASMHHERLDGAGYPRGLEGAAIPMTARVLAAADVYHAVTEPRPHRPARTGTDAAGILSHEVRQGHLDGEAVRAVLGAAGHRTRRRPELPAGLTRREVQVLEAIVRGLSNRQIAERLTISPKTVSSHVEHIHTKLGVSTRAAAALFAMRHGLIGLAELDER